MEDEEKRPTANEQTSAEEIYQLVIARLNKLRASALIEDIDKSIARGKVDSTPAESSKTFRQLAPEERLSVALEHILAALDVPVMLARCKTIINCDQLVWDGQSANDSASLSPDAEFTEKLKNLVAVLDALQLPFPELT